MKNKYRIPNERASLYKKYLSTKDYKEVARRSKYSFSTVNNILAGTTLINDENKVVIKAFDFVLKKRAKIIMDDLNKIEELIGLN